MHGEETLISLAVIVVMGIAAHWLAWRTRIPSIILLLAGGFAAGIFGLVDPDALFGDLLFPVVSLAVAVILFEGGLSLRFDDVKEIGRTVLLLVSVGAAVTWVISATAASLVLGMPVEIAVLFGAILTVTGPTVIVPLLNLVKPLRPTGPILKWEGIVIDPIGAMLTVLVFEAIVVGNDANGASIAIVGPLRTILAGGVIGAAAAFAMAWLLKKYMLPDFLHNPVALAFVVAAFTASNVIQEESGLFAAPLMGVILANRKRVSVRHITEFQENIRVLLLAGLFIVLGARVSPADLSGITWRSFVFLAVLILVARPAAVALSTIGSTLSRKERIFLGAIAPRGVVAAAVASLYSIRLVDAGFPSGERLVAEIFFVIVGTVLLYGLAALPLAGALGVRRPADEGVVMIGAYAWVRELAATLTAEGQSVLLIDTNRDNVSAARMAGLPALHADALSPQALERIEKHGTGRVLALTPNDELNALVTLHLSEIVERAELYMLPPQRPDEQEAEDSISRHLRGRILFGLDMTFLTLTARVIAGATIWKTYITERHTYEDVLASHPSAVPLFAITERGALQVFTSDNQPVPRPGYTLIALVDRPHFGRPSGRSGAVAQQA